MTDYSHATWDSRTALKRWSHRGRFKIASDLLRSNTTDIVCDYGAGDGFFARMLLDTGIASRVVAYDPMPMPDLIELVSSRDDLELATDIAELSGRTFAKVCCFETLEHFDNGNLNARTAELAALVAPNGTLVVSVPIELGPTALFKFAVRAATNSLHDGMTIKTAYASAIYCPPKRPTSSYQSGYIASHLGADYRDICRSIENAGLELKLTTFSPVPVLGVFFNSQVFFIFERAAESKI